MKFIAIDASAENLIVVASDGEKIEKVEKDAPAVRHSELIMVAVEEALIALGIDLSEIELISVVVGPGSFTGIRVGVATAKGLAAARNIPLLGVTSLESLAYAYHGEEEALCLVDARHGNYYAAGYDGEKITRSPRFISRAELENISDCAFVGGEKIDGVNNVVVDVAEGLINATCALKDRAGGEEKLKPFYLRLSQAEEGRK